MKQEDAEILRQAVIAAAKWNDANGVWTDEDCDAEGQCRLTVDNALRIFTWWARDEILGDVNSGRVPKTVSSFSELHDHVDANCYGLTEKVWEEIQTRAPERAVELSCEFVSSMQDRLDKWIKEGGIINASVGGV